MHATLQVPARKLPEAQLPTPQRIMEIGWGFWGSCTLMSGIDLGVFTHLARGPQSADAIAAALGLHHRGVRDFLDTLVSMKLLNRQHGIYSNTPEANLYLNRESDDYLGGIFEMASKRLYASWGKLSDSLITGKSQSRMVDFDAFYGNEEGARVFASAMTGLSRALADAIAQKFDFAPHKTFVDVGCAQGGATAQVARRHPHLHGIGFDLPILKGIFEQYVETRKVGDRVKFLAGNFFKESLPQADVVLLGHILHDWNLAEKKAILAKAFAALPSGGAVVVYDCIIDNERRNNTAGLLMSLNMLIETPGGFDYTAQDCLNWLQEAGFVNTHVEHIGGAESMAVGFKK